MKAQIHPKYYPEAIITCSCGRSFTSGSTKESINVEVCSKCHPFYTGEQRFLDSKGAVDKFLKREKDAAGYKIKVQAKKDKKDTKSNKSTKSLRELLGEV